jgi:hypothetical protein
MFTRKKLSGNGQYAARHRARARQLARRLCLEELESRIALSTVTLKHGVLTLKGNSWQDKVIVAENGPILTVTMNCNPESFPIDQVDKIYAKLGRGDDFFDGTKTIIRTKVDASSGNDWIETGSGDDEILLGKGADHGNAGDGVNSMRGGKGPDDMIDGIFGDTDFRPEKGVDIVTRNSADLSKPVDAVLGKEREITRYDTIREGGLPRGYVRGVVIVDDDDDDETVVQVPVGQPTRLQHTGLMPPGEFTVNNGKMHGPSGLMLHEFTVEGTVGGVLKGANNLPLIYAAISQPGGEDAQEEPAGTLRANTDGSFTFVLAQDVSFDNRWLQSRLQIGPNNTLPVGVRFRSIGVRGPGAASASFAWDFNWVIG